MKITSLALTSFKSHPETLITFDKLTIVRSLNGVGKTSIENAFQLALAGRCDGTTSDGKGSIGLIRKGSSKSTIKVAIDDDGAQRLVQANLNGAAKTVAVVDPTNEQWPDGAQYADWLKSNREVLSCLINNRHFVGQSEDAQKDILSAILLPKTYAWPDWVMPAANSLGLKVDWRLSPFEVIEQAHDLAYKERTGINRDVKNFRAPEGDTSKASAFDEVSAKLDTRKKELESAVAALATAKAQHVQAGSARAAAKSRFLEVQERVQREEEAVTRFDGMLLSAAALKKAQEAAKGAEKVAKLDAEIVRIGAELKMEKGKRDQLSTLAGLCPTCHTPITDELIASLAKPVLAEIERLAEQEREAIAERKKLGDPVDAAKQVSDHEQAQQSMVAAKGRAEDERRILADALKKLDAIPNAAEAPDWTQEEAAIADLRNRVQLGSAALAECKAAQELVIRKANAEKDRKALLAKQETVDRLVRYFGDEVKTELLSGAVEPFVKTVNSVLANWGYTAHISIEPYFFALTFRSEGGPEHYIELGYLSKSQRYRFATAFQVALAVATGFRFVVVDEGDIFFADVRKELFHGLNAALENGELDQAIVLVTDDKNSAPTQEQAPGTVIWMLENSSDPDEIPTTTARQLGV